MESSGGMAGAACSVSLMPICVGAADAAASAAGLWAAQPSSRAASGRRSDIIEFSPVAARLFGREQFFGRAQIDADQPADALLDHGHTE